MDGAHSFVLKSGQQMTEFRDDEGADSANLVQNTQNSTRINSTLETVENLDRLFKEVIVKKSHESMSMEQIFKKKFGAKHDKVIADIKRRGSVFINSQEEMQKLSKALMLSSSQAIIEDEAENLDESIA